MRHETRLDPGTGALGGNGTRNSEYRPSRLLNQIEFGERENVQNSISLLHLSVHIDVDSWRQLPPRWTFRTPLRKNHIPSSHTITTRPNILIETLSPESISLAPIAYSPRQMHIVRGILDCRTDPNSFPVSPYFLHLENDVNRRHFLE